MSNALADFGKSRLNSLDIATNFADIRANLPVIGYQNGPKAYNQNTERGAGSNNGCLFTHFRILQSSSPGDPQNIHLFPQKD